MSKNNFRSSLHEYGSVTIVEEEQIEDSTSWVKAHVIEAAEATSLGNEITNPSFRDIPFAIAFLLHLFIVLMLGMTSGSFELDSVGDEGGSETITDDKEMTSVYMSRILSHMALPCGIASFFFSFFVTAIGLPLFPEKAVGASLLCFIPNTIITQAFIFYFFPNFLMAIFSVLMVCFSVYYVMMSWRFVPFTACNLMMGVRAVNMNFGIYLVSILISIGSFGWFVFWFYAMNGISRGVATNCEGDDCDPNYTIISGLVFSLYWTTIVLMNAGQTTVAGVVATWCFDKENASACCSEAVTSSLSRSFSYSFGSICFGSLLNALVMLLRYLSQVAEQNRDEENVGCSILYCVIQCILIMIQDIIEYFNRWAYIFVGIYGMSYLESGKAVLELFNAKGFTTIISDDLTHMALGTVTFFSGICSGFVGLLIVGCFSDGFFFSADVDGVKIHAFWISFLSGVVISSMMMNVIQGAVQTVIVCYADNPHKLLQNHPEETRKISETWLRIFPDLSMA